MKKNKPRVILKEMTAGCAYNKFEWWFRDGFYVILTDQGLTIWNWVIFRKITIPKQYIQKLTIDPITYWGVTQNLLRVIHSYPNTPKIIRFRSSDHNHWFEAFKENSIPIESNEQLKPDFYSSEQYKNLCLVMAVVIFIVTLVMLFLMLNKKYY